MSDIRDAFRALRATPVVSAVAILSLALGIGANTATFSILNAAMLRTLPVQEPQRLVQVLTGPTRTSWSNPLWEQLRDHQPPIFDGVFAYSSPQFNLARGGEAQPVNGMMASGATFEVLGVPTILGRTFTAADDVLGGGKDGPVAVISYAFWQRHFGGTPAIIGQHLSLDRVDFTIIGVTPPSFTGLDRGRMLDVAVPLGVEPLIRGTGVSAMKEPTWWWLRTIGRLKPGDTIEKAATALRGIQPQLREATLPTTYRPKDLPNYLKDPFALRPASEGPNSFGRTYQQPLYIMITVVGLVLLIACANLANLLLARANARRHELSIRVALGASRWRIARQLLVESACLSLLGAALGLVFAQWSARGLIDQLSLYGSRVSLDVGIDWRLLGFTAAVAIATALLFGTVPALRATRVAPSDAIKEQGRSIVGESRLGFGGLLVVGQVALSLVLVVAAGLFVRTFANLARVPLGFDPNPVLTIEVDAKNAPMKPAERIPLYERLREAAAAVPGVKTATLQSITPLSNSQWDTLIENPPGLSLSERERDVHMNAVGPDWFATYATPIVAGRDFTLQDGVGAQPVVIVNETFARKYFPGASPVGRFVRNEPRPGVNPPRMLIIGVARDAVYDSLKDAVPPTMYKAALQDEGGTSVEMAVRAAAGSPALLTRSLASALERVNGDLTLTFTPVAEIVRDFTAQQRIIAMLSAFFGGLALLLAAVGLYGVMSYAVSRRRTEIGIRMALGAGPAGAVRLILLRVAVLVGLGVAVGVGLSLWASHFVASLLFDLGPRDPWTVIGAALVLSLIGALAGWLPARRASRIDPAQILRA